MIGRDPDDCSICLPSKVSGSSQCLIIRRHFLMQINVN